MTARLERLTSLEGVQTVATKISMFYNLKSSKLRVVSADGMLYCIPDKLVRHIDFFYNLTTAEDVTPSEVVLTDIVLENANVLRKYLEILNGRTLHATRPCKSTAMELPLRLAAKFGDMLAKQTLLFIITHHLDLNCHHCTPAKALGIGGLVRSDMLIRKAMAKLVASEESAKALKPEDLLFLSCEETYSILTALLSMVPRTRAAVKEFEHLFDQAKDHPHD